MNSILRRISKMAQPQNEQKKQQHQDKQKKIRYME
mgnify:CR=1 FL=1